jgi:hypothetical protein
LCALVRLTTFAQFRSVPPRHPKNHSRLAPRGLVAITPPLITKRSCDHIKLFNPTPNDQSQYIATAENTPGVHMVSAILGHTGPYFINLPCGPQKFCQKLSGICWNKILMDFAGDPVKLEQWQEVSVFDRHLGDSPGFRWYPKNRAAIRR